MFEKLPVEYTFSYNPKGKFFLPKQSLPTIMKGEGQITLAFERTAEEKMLAVSLRNIRLRYPPFNAPIDVDGDGWLEHIELGSIRIDTRAFNLETSKGSLNLETGELELILEALITPDLLPILDGRLKERISQLIGSKPISYRVRERGKLNTKTGEYYVFSTPQIIEEGPFAGTLILDSGRDEGTSTPPPSTVDLNVVIPRPGTRSCGDQRQSYVLICEGDTILLCWTSSQDVASVDLNPGAYAGLPANYIRAEIPTLPSSPNAEGRYIVEYIVTTNGGNTPGVQDTVTVEFYRGGDISFQADPADREHAWIGELSEYSYSGGIEVHEIELNRGSGCLDWGRFQVEQLPSFFNGTIENGRLTVPVAMRFPARGIWRFYPLSETGNPVAPPDPQDEQLPLCVKIRGSCTPRR